MRDILPDIFFHIIPNLKNIHTKLTCWCFLLWDPVDLFCALVCYLSSFLWVVFVCNCLVLALLVVGSCRSVPGCSPSLSISSPPFLLCVCVGLWWWVMYVCCDKNLSQYAYLLMCLVARSSGFLLSVSLLFNCLVLVLLVDGTSWHSGPGCSLSLSMLSLSSPHCV